MAKKKQNTSAETPEMKLKMLGVAPEVVGHSPILFSKLERTYADYPTLEAYKAALEKMNISEMQLHCTSVTLLPHHDREIMQKRLVARYEKMAMETAPINEKPTKPKNMEKYMALLARAEKR